MTMKKRINALEAKGLSELPWSVRAWLGHVLTPEQEAIARIEAAQPLPSIDEMRLSKEAREWLLG